MNCGSSAPRAGMSQDGSRRESDPRRITTFHGQRHSFWMILRAAPGHGVRKRWAQVVDVPAGGHQVNAAVVIEVKWIIPRPTKQPVFMEHRDRVRGPGPLLAGHRGGRRRAGLDTRVSHRRARRNSATSGLDGIRTAIFEDLLGVRERSNPDWAPRQMHPMLARCRRRYAHRVPSPRP